MTEAKSSRDTTNIDKGERELTSLSELFLIQTSTPSSPPHNHHLSDDLTVVVASQISQMMADFSAQKPTEEKEDLKGIYGLSTRANHLSDLSPKMVNNPNNLHVNA